MRSMLLPHFWSRAASTSVVKPSAPLTYRAYTAMSRSLDGKPSHPQFIQLAVASCTTGTLRSVSPPDLLDSAMPAGPSPINPLQKMFTPEGMKHTITPRALTNGEIIRAVKDYGVAPKHAKEAGFDGVEVRGSVAWNHRRHEPLLPKPRSERSLMPRSSISVKLPAIRSTTLI
jgi:hypothetical protein